MKKYKFITIMQQGNEAFEGKPVYRIFNNKSGKQLGVLSFYKPWKQFVFSSQPDCVFNSSCLMDVLDFLEVEMPKVIRLASKIDIEKEWGNDQWGRPKRCNFCRLKIKYNKKAGIRGYSDHLVFQCGAYQRAEREYLEPFETGEGGR